jgi:hypothetical protein
LYRIGVNTTLSHLKRNRFRRFFSLENIQEEGSNAQVLETLAAQAQVGKGRSSERVAGKIERSDAETVS